MKALIALALFAALLGGCSGTTTTGPPTPTQDAQGHYVIQMVSPSNQFSPKEAKVPLGANVTWTNTGTAPHNAKDLGSPPAFSSEYLSSGKSFTHKFDTAGTYHYHCDLHTGMEGTLIVG